MAEKKPVWIAREYSNCSGCRKCEIACSLHHEGLIWPEASRIRVFMLVPGLEFPHLCAQCQNYPCVQSCPTEALTVDRKTAAVLVHKEKCTACGSCIESCPGNIPHMHPAENHILICDLCAGDPRCVNVCQQGRWNALKVVTRKDRPHELYARKPEEITRDLSVKIYGESGESFL